MTTPTGRFRRADRLLHSRDFRRVAGRGKRAAGRYFVVLMAPAPPRLEQEVVRLGITVSRQVGGAVVRNRLKRWIRVWFREARSGLEPGMDLVVIARRGAADLPLARVWESLEGLVESVGAKP
ncbi:MAG: ribonuclease P protein component [Myxococcales bacterium]|nr:ribonuclease P protein component [Myxococcales bacterium]